MDLIGLLQNHHSKSTSASIVGWVGRNSRRFSLLMELFLGDDKTLNQRSAWPLGMIADQNPELFIPYLNSLLVNLEHPVHDAVIRCTLKAWIGINIPENLEGEIYEKCFHFLTYKKYPAAIKVFSMTVLTNIAQNYPELKEELRNQIEIQYRGGSAGFKARARKELNRL